MRLSQQPALGALTFLRSFVAGKANFCSHLLASLVHFTVVKSQAILIIRLRVTEVISAVTLYLLPCQLQNDEISTSLDMSRHNNFACGLCLSIVALTATICLYNVSGEDELIKRKKSQKTSISNLFLINISQLQLHSKRGKFSFPYLKMPSTEETWELVLRF